MLSYLDSASSPAKANYDVCVIGAGPAGLTIATRLARNGRKVFLAEAGGTRATLKSQMHYRGTVAGDPYFDLMGTRLRYFGGSSGTWGGLCRELDALDFETKIAAPLTAWPISRQELSRYADAAAEILQVKRQRPDRALNPDLNEVFFEFSPPVRFGEEFRGEVSSSSNIDAYLNCNFVGFQYDGSSITSAEFCNYSGFKATVQAQSYVLACGGIENSRILLIENEKFDNRIGNQSGLVGRYWTEHHHFTIGDFFLFEDDVFTTKPRITPLGAESLRIFVAPSRQFMVRQGILNCGLRLWPLYERQGAKKYLADLLCMAPDLSNSLLERFGTQLLCAGTIRAAWEQHPEIDNRIVLTRQSDSLGLPRCELRWKKTNRDKLAPRKAALALGKFLAERDYGRIKLAPWLLQDNDHFPSDDEIGGNHHMGGTRMAALPGDGVVDPNCRVFGTTNLSVAGSSVFPSGGHANPMFSTVQLAVRLAERLHAEL